MKPLDALVSEYPHFYPDQVLTSEHLNDLADYLEQQTRLTRQKLIGIGVVCGLEVNFETEGGVRVEISGGVGITSEGYLICQDRTECTHARPFEVEGYPPFEAVGGVFELLEAPDDDVDAVLPLSRFPEAGSVAIDGRVVVLLLEKADRQTDICLDETCDRKGWQYELTVRKLLVEPESMEEIRGRLPDLRSEAPAALLNEYELPKVFIPRAAAEDGQVDWTGVGSADEFVQAYEAAIVEGGELLREALDRLFDEFKPWIDLQSGTVSNPFEVFDPAELFELARRGEIPVQYAYDWVLDIAAAYEETRRRLFLLVGQCSPDPGLFPCHLGLGIVRHRRLGGYDWRMYEDRDPFRDRFIPSPAISGQHSMLLEVQRLLHRLVLVVSSR